MARKYVKSFIFYDEHETDIDTIINSWLDSKHEEVGKTIARFEMLYIEPIAMAETKNSVASISLFIIYTELRL